MKKYIGRARLVSVKNKNFSIIAPLFWERSIQNYYFALGEDRSRKFFLLEKGWIVYLRGCDKKYRLYKVPVMRTHAIDLSFLSASTHRYRCRILANQTAKKNYRSSGNNTFRSTGLYLSATSLVEAHGLPLWGHL